MLKTCFWWWKARATFNLWCKMSISRIIQPRHRIFSFCSHTKTRIKDCCKLHMQAK